MRAVPAPPAAVAVNAATHEQTGVPLSLERRRQITVRYGDTLEGLAIHYFRSRSGINALIDANPQLTNINRLSIGQIIYLPSDSTPKASHDHHSLISSTELLHHVDAGGGDTSGPNTAPVENPSSSSASGPSAVPDHNGTNAGVGRNVSTVSAGNHAVDATANLSAAAAVVPDRPNLSLLKLAPEGKIGTGAEAESDPLR
jgi:phage tail protein X